MGEDFRGDGGSMAGDAQRADEGFSLLELMTVVAIIAVIAAIAVASFTVSVERSRRIACIHNQRLMDSGLMQYQIMNKGLWPATLAETEPYVDWSGDDYATCASDPSQPLQYDPTNGAVWCVNHSR
jgi:prepilin-type N-terminal cleavage/methylation domain-containing protein